MQSDVFAPAEIKVRMIECILENAKISVNPLGIFADKINHGEIIRALSDERKNQVEEQEIKQVLDESESLRESRAIAAMADFGHTCPDWEFILENGITGVLSILDRKLEREGLCEKQKAFYNYSKRVYEAMLRCLERSVEEAERQIEKSENAELMAKSLRNLTHSVPQTMHEAMQLIMFYYEMQQHIDAVFVRSLGKLDALLYRY